MSPPQPMDDPAGADQVGPEGLRRRTSSVEAAAVAGLAYAILSFASFSLFIRLPEASSAADIAEYYADPNERRLDFLAVNLAAFSSIAFLWFVAVIRRRIGDREDRFFGTVFFGSGIVLVGLTLVGSAALASPALGIDFAGGVAPSQDVYTAVIGLGNGLLLSVVLRVQAIFVITTSTLIFRTGALPKWLAISGYGFALLLLVTPLVTGPSGAVFPAWVAVISIALLVRRAEARLDDQPP